MPLGTLYQGSWSRDCFLLGMLLTCLWACAVSGYVLRLDAFCISRSAGRLISLLDMHCTCISVCAGLWGAKPEASKRLRPTWVCETQAYRFGFVYLTERWIVVPEVSVALVQSKLHAELLASRFKHYAWSRIVTT